MRQLSSFAAFFLFFSLFTSIAYSDISAESRDKAVVAQEFDAAFEQMLDDPSDVKLTLHYAKLAVELGDYESAIPPLERLLIQNPSLTKVRLEVGIMYFLLNSPSVATQYLTEVTEDKSATADQVAKAKEYLAKM